MLKKLKNRNRSNRQGNSSSSDGSSSSFGLGLGLGINFGSDPENEEVLLEEELAHELAVAFDLYSKVSCDKSLLSLVALFCQNC